MIGLIIHLFFFFWYSFKGKIHIRAQFLYSQVAYFEAVERSLFDTIENYRLEIKRLEGILVELQEPLSIVRRSYTLSRIRMPSVEMKFSMPKLSVPEVCYCYN